MQIIKNFGNALQSPLLLLIRLFWGYQFFISGLGKFLHLDDIAQFFGSLGIPFPYWNVVLAGSAELIGGALLFVGLFSRIVSIPLLATMLVAYATAHRDSLISLAGLDPEPFLQQGPFLFAYAAVIVFCFGPGKFSLDYLLTDARTKGEMP